MIIHLGQVLLLTSMRPTRKHQRAASTFTNQFSSVLVLLRVGFT